MEIKNKNQKIINLRALAIILVVFGHSIILYSSIWNLYTTEMKSQFLDTIKDIINIIQMPLFFSISGYLFYFSYKKRNVKELFLEKVKRLIIPFLIISILWMVPIRVLLNYPGYANLSFQEIIINKVLIGQDSGHMWFLPTLFYIFIFMKIILNILEKTKSKWQYYLLAIVIFVIGATLYLNFGEKIASYYPYLNSAMSNFIYFYLGFFINKYKIENLINKNKIVKCVLFLLNVLGIALCLIMKNEILQVLVGLYTVAMLYAIIPENANKGINILSENSFGIYLFHSPLIYITFTYFSDTNPIFVVGLNFIVWGICSLAISMLLKNTKLKFIIGEK